jgi:hypothetical protein
LAGNGFLGFGIRCLGCVTAWFGKGAVPCLGHRVGKIPPAFSIFSSYIELRWFTGQFFFQSCGHSFTRLSIVIPGDISGQRSYSRFSIVESRATR